MKKSTSGFTVVELVTVIVVIGILAAITVVAYTGMQHDARVSSAQSDLTTLSKATQLYKTFERKLPLGNEWAKVLKEAKLYESTRDDKGKTFMFCQNGTDYAIVAAGQILNEVNGAEHYYTTSMKGGMQTFNWNVSTPGTFTIQKGCAQTSLPSVTYSYWSFAVTE